ncbi:MAG: NuoM family protein [Candidatus Methylumidiphilus sp.]
MAADSFPFLSLLIFLPLAAGVLLFAARDERLLLPAALGVSLLELALALAALWQLQPGAAGLQLAESHAWIPSLNIHYQLGVDGVSAPFLPLAALLNACAVAASAGVRGLRRLYFALLLGLQSATMGVFCAVDVALFFLFWELTLPPVFFLISLWGIGPQRRHAATQYALFMLAGGALLLWGFVLLALNHAQETALAAPAGLNFDYATLLETPAALDVQRAVFVLLFLGFAVKAPLFPCHVWLPQVAMQGPAGVVALLAGLKLGLYGIIRFAIPLAPQAAQQYAGWLAGLGALGALYGGLVALRQTNLRRMLAFSSVSHVGLVLIGVAAYNLPGIQGAVLQTLGFGLTAGGLFLLAGFLHRRLGSTELTSLGGIARTLPTLAGLLFGLGAAGMAAPGGIGFAAENLIVIGALQAHIGAGLAALLAAVLGAAYFLRFFRRAFFGPPQRGAAACDLLPGEAWAVIPLALLALAFGLFPRLLLDYSQKPLQTWVARLEAGHSPSLADLRKSPLAPAHARIAAAQAGRGD